MVSTIKFSSVEKAIRLADNREKASNKIPISTAQNFAGVFIPLDVNPDYNKLIEDIEKIDGIQEGVIFMVDGTTRPSIGENQQMHFYLEGCVRNTDIPEEE